MTRLIPRTTKQWLVALAALGLCVVVSLLAPDPAQPPDSAAPSPTLPAQPPSRAIAVAIPTPTPQPALPTPTPNPTAAPTPQPASPTPTGPTAAQNANLRQGPGLAYPIASSASAGDPLAIIAANPAQDWYQLASGHWIAAFLVADPPPAGLPIVAPPIPPTAAPLPPSSALPGIQLVVIRNSRSSEILEIRNSGPSPIDISAWQLYGSLGDDRCTIPPGVILQPAAAYQIATGDSQPAAAGYKCGDKTIWNNQGETIYLRAPDGRQLQIRT